MQRFTRSISFFFSMFLLFPCLSVAQRPAFGPQQVITTGADDARSVFAADLDGDGDKDVLSASAGDNKIARYKNTDGLGAFGPQQVITTATSGARSVYAADLDGDGDMDVLSASFGDNKVAWYENTDGQGSFGAQQVITTAADVAESAYAADLDGDSDLDVLSASFRDDKIAWYENSDGLGSFGAQQVITTAADEARSVYAADLDGDGDLDVLSASFRDDKIAWYRNLSNPTSVATEDRGYPKTFKLSQNYPNPFNPETIISYQLPEATEVELEIYNLLGERVLTLVDRRQSAGDYSVKWRGTDDSGRRVTSGVYIYRLKTRGFVESKRMLLLR